MPIILFSVTFLSGVLMLASSEYEVPERPISSMSSSDEEAAFVESIPKTWDVTTDNPESRGWRQTGVVPASIPETIYAVRTLMHQFGYTERHGAVASECQTLMEFHRDGGGGVMWMLWLKSDDETGYSWGVVK